MWSSLAQWIINTPLHRVGGKTHICILWLGATCDGLHSLGQWSIYCAVVRAAMSERLVSVALFISYVRVEYCFIGQLARCSLRCGPIIGVGHKWHPKCTSFLPLIQLSICSIYLSTQNESSRCVRCWCQWGQIAIGSSFAFIQVATVIQDLFKQIIAIKSAVCAYDNHKLNYNSISAQSGL